MTSFALDGMTLDDVINTFEMLDDWDERYRLIIDLGRKLPPLPGDAYCDANKVRGCQSQVWMLSDQDEQARLHLRGDSDAHIVKGLIGLLLLIYSGKPAREIADTDIKAIFKQMDLEGHLSSQRANGLFAMVERIQNMAREAA